MVGPDRYEFSGRLDGGPARTLAFVYQRNSSSTLSSLHGAFLGPFSTALAEQFPARIRATALGISYNVGVMTFGAFAQFFVTWLIQATGSPIAPVFYVMFGAAMGLVATSFLVDRSHELHLRATDGAPVRATA